MANQNVGNLVERRFDVIKSVSSFGTTARFAHFLNPCASSIDGARPDLPPNSFSPNPCAQPKIEVVFKGWKHPQEKWRIWFERMQPLYQPIWEMAGIHHALKNSIYKISQNKDVILGFAERWCSKTQSFVFPWGESTITLEDVMILGGYPVVGNSIGRCLTAEEASCCHKLEEMRKMLVGLPSKRKASQSLWFMAFMEVCDGVEHEAFLSLWLSRFVFPTTSESVVPSVFPIAVRLARGERIALAPALLARLYHDLNMVKTCMGQGNDSEPVKTWAPFQLLQVWVWERFRRLRPQPNFVENGEPRLARWHEKEKEVEDIRFAIDSAAEHFYWRPYVATNNNPVSREFYRDTEEWVAVNNVELESFVRCLMVCQLVGIGGKDGKKDCIEQYLPHRVAMQFGFDQDVPGHVQANCRDPDIAWSNYIKPIEDGRVMFFPSRADSAMSCQYLTWWWHPSTRTDL